jgi:hypothetical protein
MSKLHVMTGDEPAAKPPRKLGRYGADLWRKVMAEYEISDAGGLELLASASAALDRAERCQAWATRSSIVKARAGGALVCLPYATKVGAQRRSDQAGRATTGTAWLASRCRRLENQLPAGRSGASPSAPLIFSTAWKRWKNVGAAHPPTSKFLRAKNGGVSTATCMTS